MTDCAVCYATDVNFMLPTLISAAGLRRFVPAHRADIYILAFDDDAERITRVAAAARGLQITIVPMASRMLGGVDWSAANVTHVPQATLGRFFLDDVLPQRCARIVYLDGDTWIRRDPSALVDYRIPEGRLAAAEDISSFCCDDVTAHGRFVRDYFHGIGLHPGCGYFNAGVFAVGRATWRTVARDALGFFVANTAACKFHDQSALNAVVGDRRLRLSPAWNFQTPYRYWRTDAEANPAIYHFTQGPKPWTGAVEPWAEMFLPYQREIDRFAALDLPLQRLSSSDVARANALSRWQDRKLRYLFPHRLWTRRRMLRRFLADSPVMPAAA
jgi:lipopolysaccharide biosynthesis glycosyltransferase